MKKLTAMLLVLMLSVAVLAGCGSTDQDPMVYSTVYSGEVATINYLVTATENDFALAANLVDTLICFDRYGQMVPALATDWNLSEDGLTWTLNIRQGVYWYTHTGEQYAEVTADDWVAAAEYILDPENASRTANLLYRVIEGAEDYYNGEITDFSQVGVRAVDSHTLEYTLKQPTPYFLSMLNYVNFFPANRQFLAEVGDRFGTDNQYLLYNGAYILETFEHQNRRILVKNENYWDADNVFITELNYQYNAEAAALAPELFLRGEITGASIPAASIQEWMEDEEKSQMVRAGLPSFFTFWWAFNFEPQYDEVYAPGDWKIAVNNTNFRKSLTYALNRHAAFLTAEPYFPEYRLHNTITPRDFASVDGVDYVDFGPLAQFQDYTFFQPDKAQEFRDLAKAELEGQVQFPIQVVMAYNTGSSQWTQRVQVVQQQLEGLLGDDFIKIVPLGHPPTGFLDGTRRAGQYSFMEVNWGPDFADPETYIDPFQPNFTYSTPEAMTETNEDGVVLYDIYLDLIAEARAEVLDIQRRFQLFAEAEAFLIENAFVLPYHRGGGGYVASHLNPFDNPYSPFGVARLRYKGRQIMDEPMGPDQFDAEHEAWHQMRRQLGQ